MNKRGFTLAELLLAAVVLTLTLCGLLALFTACAMLNDSSRNLTTATSHARYILEDIRNAGWTGLEARINGGGTNGWDLNTSQVYSVYGLSPLGGESIATNVGIGTTNPLGVSVTVNWNDRGNRPRSVTFNTAVTNY